ncbi:hypothetical protein BCR35DRAFT_335464 [Leucosporidium creatinivorum]|nr:hypothetical protein BCR35DRAFT_335464 [Leucosporidium creatinivorum]
MAPLLAEEIHHFAQGASADPKADVAEAGSVFEKVWALPSVSWDSPETKTEMEELFKVREEVMSLLEQAREKKLIGSSTEATVVISNPPARLRKHAELLKTLFIVSDVSLVDEPLAPSTEWHFSSGSITVQPATLAKCPRCWTFSKPAESERDVCARCHEVVGDVAHAHW